MIHKAIYEILMAMHIYKQSFWYFSKIEISVGCVVSEILSDKKITFYNKLLCWIFMLFLSVYPLLSVDLSHSALRKFLSLVVESNFHVSVYTQYIYIHMFKNKKVCTSNTCNFYYFITQIQLSFKISIISLIYRIFLPDFLINVINTN